MAAGLGFKTFTTGEVLTAADVNGYLMQGILVFATEAARNSAITSPQEGQFAFTKDNNSLWYYTGSAWVASGATGDIEGVTAGVGISGGGTSGTVTITNSMATAIDAKGDLVPGTGADTFSRLAVGANGTVLTADSAEATGLKWATPASGGSLTLLSTTTLTTTTNTISISPTGYENIFIIFRQITGSTNNTVCNIRLNGDTGNNYYYSQWRQYPGANNFQSGQSQPWIEFTNALGTSNGGNSLSGSMDIWRCNDTSQIPVEIRQFNFNDSSQNAWYHTLGKYMASTAISSISLIANSTNTLGGTVYVYGVK